MKVFKHLKIYLLLLAIIAVAVLFMFNDLLTYGLIASGVALLFFWIWSIFIKTKEEKIATLHEELHKKTHENDTLKTENEVLRNRKLNVAEIKNILELGLMEIDTHFTRSWNDKFNHKSKSVHFIGALQVNIVARYGVDLAALRIKHDKVHNVLTVANINPKFLSFNDLDYRWSIAELLEYKQPWFGAGHWRTSDQLHGLGEQIKEELRAKTHQEVKNGPEELDWVVEPLKKQIENTLQLLLGTSGRTIEIVDSFDDTFKTLDDYTNDNNSEKES